MPLAQVLAENKEHSDHTSYSWCLLRLACVKRAQVIVKTFLEVPQLDMQGKTTGNQHIKPLTGSVAAGSTLATPATCSCRLSHLLVCYM